MKSSPWCTAVFLSNVTCLVGLLIGVIYRRSRYSLSNASASNALACRQLKSRVPAHRQCQNFDQQLISSGTVDAVKSKSRSPHVCYLAMVIIDELVFHHT